MKKDDPEVQAAVQRYKNQEGQKMSEKQKEVSNSHEEVSLPEAPASINFRARSADGWEVMFTLRGDKMTAALAAAENISSKLSTLDKLFQALSAAGWGPVTRQNYNHNSKGNSSGNAQANGEPPLCPTHGKPMKASQYGGWYCPVKIAEDGGDGKPVYCRQKVK